MLAPVVLLHGWAFDSAIWQPLQAALGSEVAVLPLNLPGYGDNGQLEPLESDQLLPWLQARLPASCHLVGWSLGGQIAVQYALRYPRSVRSLATVCSNPQFVKSNDWPGADPALLVDYLQRLPADCSQLLRQFAAQVALGCGDSRQLTRQLRAQLRPPPIAVLRQGLQCLQAWQLQQQWRALTTPFMHVLGADDVLVPAELAAHLDNCRVMPKHGHGLPLSAAQPLAQILLDHWQQVEDRHERVV